MENKTSINYKPALISLAVLYFMMGFITVLNDTLVPFFKAGFTLTYSQSSLVQFYFFLTYGLISIPSGRIIEKIGYKNGMVTGFLIAAFGAFLFYPASIFHTYELFLAALFIIAIGIVLLQVAANPYITVLGPSKTAASRLTLIQGVGSIGTTVSPLFGAYFILSRLEESSSSSDAVIKPYILIGAGLLTIALVVSRLSLPVIKSEPVKLESDQLVKSVFSFRNLKYGVIAIFMYVGAEVAIGTFLTNYIADTLEIEEYIANNYVAFYWGGMLVGRLIGALVLKSIKPSYVLTVAGVLASLLIIISIFSSGNIAVWTMVGVGFFNSIMFAVIFSLSVAGLGSLTTRGSGMLSTAIVGGAIIPYLQGLMIDLYNWNIAFIVPLICYLFIVFYGLYGYKPNRITSFDFKST